jgi:hypothetical protein
MDTGDDTIFLATSWAAWRAAASRTSRDRFMASAWTWAPSVALKARPRGSR